MYALKWQPPDSAHRLVVPLNDPQIQENTLIRIHNMKNKAASRKIIFFFGPVNPSMPLFAPTIHPASLWDFSTRDLVLKKLCDSYLEGKIEANDFENILINGYDIWKLSVYNLLKDDEQVYHEYLHEKKGKEITMGDYEKKYYDDEITLQEFADFKYPERKKMREIEQQSYPRPYETGTCIICQGKNGHGLIKCVNCINLVCVNCIHTYFLDENSPDHEGSFLLMHRRFCLKLGKMVQISPYIAPQPGYLNELKLSGRIAALEKLNPHEKDEYTEEVEEDDDVEEQLRLQEEELRKQREAEEYRRKIIERPPEFDDLCDSLDKYEVKYNKIKKDIITQQHKLEEKGHSDNYYERLNRLKDEDMQKLENKIGRNISKIQLKVAELALPGKPSEIILYRTEDLLKLIGILSTMENAMEFEKLEYRILKGLHWHALLDTLPTSVPDHMCKVDYDMEEGNDVHDDHKHDEHKHDDHHDRHHGDKHHDQYRDGESAVLMLQEAEDKHHHHHHHDDEKKGDDDKIDSKNNNDDDDVLPDQKNSDNDIVHEKSPSSQSKHITVTSPSAIVSQRSGGAGGAGKKSSLEIVQKQKAINEKQRLEANPKMRSLSIKDISVNDLFDSGTLFDKQDPGVTLRIGPHLHRTNRIKEAGTSATFPEQFTEIQLISQKIREEALELQVEVGNIDAKGNLKCDLGSASAKLKDLFHEYNTWIDITMNLSRGNNIKGEVKMKGMLSSEHDLKGVPNIHLYNNMVENKNRSYKTQRKSTLFTLF